MSHFAKKTGSRIHVAKNQKIIKFQGSVNMDIVRNTARRLPLACLSLIAMTFAATTAHAQKYSVLVLQGLPGGTFTSAVAINNAGQVAGTADDGRGILGDGGPYAVLWNNGVPSYLVGSPDTFFATVGGINNGGFVAGSWFEIGAFVVGPKFSSGLDDSHSIATGINDLGVVVGTLRGAGCIYIGPDISGGPSSFLQLLSGPYGSGAYTASAEPLGINNAGEIVGISFSESTPEADTTSRATRWSNGQVYDLGTLGGLNSGATAINGRGWTIGWASLGNNHFSHAALWEPTTTAYDLGTLGGQNSTALGINLEGDIAGAAQNVWGAWRAVLWTHKHFLAVDLNTEIGQKTNDITLTSAVATNDRCQVAATGYENKTGTPQSYVLTLTDQSNCDEP
jgi:probable HAF family extracellular repeat protein